MITVNASEAKTNLYDLIESAADEPVRITSERGTVIVLSEKEWEGIMETLYLLGVPGLLEDVKEGREAPRSEMIRVNSNDI